MILIAISCAGSACSVKCDLHSMSPPCHDVAHRQGHTMAGMAPAVSLCSDARVALPHAMAAPCEQHLCVERPALVTSESATAVHLTYIQQALIVTLIEWPAARSQPKWLSAPRRFEIAASFPSIQFSAYSPGL